MPAKSNRDNNTFVWVPGVGPSAAALAKLSAATQLPSTVPGEAWFMGKQRRMYHEFFEYRPQEIPMQALSEFLSEATSGTNIFVEALEEVESWRFWFRYLLPTLIVRGGEKDCTDFLMEAVVTAFFSIYRNGFNGEHSEFLENVLDTLGKAIMMPTLWDAQGESICAQNRTWSVYATPECDGALSASLFFCLSYLDDFRIESWTESVLSIDSAFYRAHFLTWLAGSYKMLAAGACSFWEIERAPIEITWKNLFLLKQMPSSISMDNRKIFLSTVKSKLTTEKLYEWLDDIAQYPPLYEPLSNARIPETIHDVVLAM
jgi:hypothetical protein